MLGVEQAPPEIRIVYPSMADGLRPFYTSTFRAGTLHPEAQALAHTLNSDVAQFNVLSAGCSIGTEPDFALALHERIEGPGDPVVVAVDADETILRQAAEGRYRTLPLRADPGNYEKAKAHIEGMSSSLEEYGFTVEGVETIEGRRAVDGNGKTRRSDFLSIVFNSQDLRERNPIDFRYADITELDVAIDGLHLITANDILCRMSIDSATKALFLMTGRLASRGVLNIGKASSFKSFPDREGRIYRNWLENMSFEFSRETEIGTIRDKNGTPVMFVARDVLKEIDIDSVTEGIFYKRSTT